MAATCWPSPCGPCSQEAGRPDPVTRDRPLSSPRPADGPLSIRAQVVKPGRTFSTVTAELVQGQRERVRVLGAFGDLSRAAGTDPGDRPPTGHPAARSVREPRPPDPAGRPAHPGGDEPLRHPACPPTARGAARATVIPFEITGWIRFRDGAEPSAFSAVAFADAFPPTLLGSARRAGWVPTIELTVHVRARPAPGWLLGTFRTRVLVDGLLEEDGELWDSQGRPIALSRQLAMVLTR